MKKAKKKQIEKVITLQKQILKVLQEKEHIENKKQKDELFILLQDCQQATITIGMTLEKTRVDNSKIITILEKYCEKLYQIATKLDVRQSVTALLQEAIEFLDNAFVELEKIQCKDIVCFLPYKASMWDSLESVWKAAEEDQNCDAYVVPIPYFDRNSDGSYGTMHYEGKEYPSYVPITHYKEFDLEEIRPDKIFIHNPYDNYNMVTSVHPDFYSSKLKDYTDMLVYIPYFILNEIDPENEAAVESMAHFCKTPGVLYAHKVIVQSEKMKQIYVKVLTEWQGEETRTTWEEKILGLGSPKVDKVLNTKKEDLEIPEEWLRIIKKSDGSWKKVIFYNTSLTTMLNNSDRYLDKVEDVLRVFYENRDDVALLWRPHPLLIQTIASMRPALKDRYTHMIQKYKDEGWGIYDESALLERAIAVSDAYYGDGSSVVQLFQTCNKLIMYQKTHFLRGNNRKQPMLFSFYIQHGDTCYASDNDGNGLYIIKDNGEVIFQGVFPNERLFQRALYVAAVEYEHCLIFIPESAKNICVYDTERKEFRSISFNLEISNSKYDEMFKFSGGRVYNRYLYFIPQTYPAMMRLDLENNEIKYFLTGFPTIDVKFSKLYAEKDNYITLVSLTTNHIMQIDVEKELISTKEYECAVVGANEVYSYKDSLWIIKNELPAVIRYSWKTEKTHIVNDFPKEFYAGEYAFASLVGRENYLYIFPATANMILQIDVENNLVSKIEIKGLIDSREILRYVGIVGKYMVFFYRPKAGMWDAKREHVFVDIDRCMVCGKYVFLYDVSTYPNWLNDTVLKGNVVDEKATFGIKEFSSYIKNWKYDNENKIVTINIYNELLKGR